MSVPPFLLAGRYVTNSTRSARAKAFSHKRRDCTAAALQNRLSVRRTRDSTGTRAHLSSSQRLPAELAVRPTFAGRPRWTASSDAAMAAARAMQLSTRRGTAWRLWLEPVLGSGCYQRLLSETHAAISGCFGIRGCWEERGRSHGRMASCDMMSM